MNYFGHALVASWDGRDGLAGRALGAMLPDLASMCGARIDGADDDAVVAGIALHHATDAAFHGLPAFVELCNQLEERLAAGGVGRGPMRGAAHVGVELLLDGVFVDDPGGRAAYLAAIARGPAGLRWRQPGDAERFAKLHARMAPYGVPDDLREPASVTYRVLRTLAPRPRLAPSAAEAEVIGRELEALAPQVRIASAAIVSGLRAAFSPEA